MDKTFHIDVTDSTGILVEEMVEFWHVSGLSSATPCKGRFKLPLEMMSSAERSNSAVNETRTKNFYQEPTGVCVSSVAVFYLE